MKLSNLRLTPAVATEDSRPDGIPNNKTGNTLTSSIHIFCAIVGAGVLAIPNSMAWLGWIAGPIMLIVFYIISLFTAFLLTEVYEVNGIEYPRYHQAVHGILGKWYSIGCTVSQLVNLVLIDIAYTISAATSMKRIAQLACEYQGKSVEDCWDYTWKMTLIFGAVQVPMSMVPNMEALWWVSAMGVATSLTYSTMGMGLSLHYAPNNLGSIGGKPGTTADKAFGALNALGAIAFAYSFHMILLEIQDTVRQPPKASKVMQRSTSMGIGLSFFYYMIIGIAGYAALGNDAPGFLFTAFPDAPKWLMIIGNICILLHMVAAYQVFGQPVFDSIESHFKAFQIKFIQKRATLDAVEAAVDHAVVSKGVVPAAGKDDLDDLDSPQKGEDEAAPPGAPELARASRASQQLHRLSKASAMYRVSTGFANPDVPSNDEFLLPIWQRFILRTLYVIATTVISCCLPFFSDMAGLLGSLTFWPLAIFFPIRMWRAVYKPTGFFNKILWTIEIVMFLVSLAAVVGSLRSIVEASKNYTVFAE